MTKIKLANGIVISSETVEINNGILEISTTNYTVEELAEIFSDSNNTKLITLMTESELESGFKTDFTNLIGIRYTPDNLKLIQLSQPLGNTEVRLSNAENVINSLLGLED